MRKIFWQFVFYFIYRPIEGIFCIVTQKELPPQLINKFGEMVSKNAFGEQPLGDDIVDIDAADPRILPLLIAMQAIQDPSTLGDVSYVIDFDNANDVKAVTYSYNHGQEKPEVQIVDWEKGEYNEG